MTKVLLTALFIIIQRLFELRVAERNRKWALRQGAREYGANHYPLFFMLHPGWLIGWVSEALAIGSRLSRWWPVWFGLFAAVQGLRYWAITSLGRYWNTRILIVPGGRRVRTGPYRLFRHPNYLAVAVELAAVPLIFGAWRTAVVASLLNAALLLGLRIPAEEAALEHIDVLS
ncbi:MAG: hypothetical protein KDI79_17870 [Anaerolineae bacterium]|nr:hypothetical protein [Anaerolineae bacterium]